MKKQPSQNFHRIVLRSKDHPGKHNLKMIVMAAALMVCISIVSCVQIDSPNIPRRQITSCPESLILICTSRQPPSQGGDDEILLYEHCTCKSSI